MEAPEVLPVEEPAEDVAAPSPVDVDAEAPVHAPPASADGVFCNQCGWKNPSGARFCSQCGTRLQALADAPAGVQAPPPARPPALPQARAVEAPDAGGNVQRQVAILIGAGVLLVLALYLVTVFSRNVALTGGGAAEASTPAASAEQQAPAEAAPLPPQVADQAAALEDEIEGLSGEARMARLRELINLYLSSGRIDQAALVQERVAQELDTPAAWTEAGNFFYGWMEASEGNEKLTAGRRAIDAYNRVLTLEPDNVDVRTDMATAYLGTNNPMEGVNQIKQVLEQNPGHVQANFNYGVMLMMISRVDQAIQQFEKVKGLVEPGSAEYRRADEAIQEIRRRTAS